MMTPKPYYDSGGITLYHADCMDMLFKLPKCDAVITDPPYGETSLEWDVWPKTWPWLLRKQPQLWCFGSMRMFFEMRDEFIGWKLAQDIVWEKHNGSGATADRFRRVHELALHFYHGEWSAIYKSPVTTPDATKRTVRRKDRPPHWGDIGESGLRQRGRRSATYAFCNSRRFMPWLRGERNAETGRNREAAA